MLAHDDHSTSQHDDSLAAALREVVTNWPLLLILLTASFCFSAGSAGRWLRAPVAVGAALGAVGGAVAGSSLAGWLAVALGVAVPAGVIASFRLANMSSVFGPVVAGAVALCTAGAIKPEHLTDLREWLVVVATSVAITIGLSMLVGVCSSAFLFRTDERSHLVGISTTTKKEE
jgi:hypothetical protein